MSVTVNLRNNTDFFIKVNGIEEVINPNSELEDKTIQWISTENKEITFFSTQECNTPQLFKSLLTFVTNDGIFVDRGEISGTQTVTLDADITGTAIRVIQSENGSAEKLLNWEEIGPETVVNLSFNKN